jgi:hypothetical protein
VRSVGRTTAPPVNRVFLTGADGMTSDKSDAGSIATYGEWTLTKSYSSLSVQATLDDRALSLLRPRPIRTLTLTPDPSAPRPFDDYSLGDTVHLYVDRGSMQEDAAVHVNAFTILVDDDGLEASEIVDPRTPDDEAAIRASLEIEIAA